MNHFDNIGAALITIMSMSQAFTWSIVMYSAIDSRGVDEVPKQNSTPYLSFYFVLFIIVGSFFMTNVFVGVMISTYNREKEKLGNQLGENHS